MGDGGLEDIREFGVENVIKHIRGGHLIPEGQAGEARRAYFKGEIIGFEAKVPHFGLRRLALLLPLLALLLVALFTLTYHLLQHLADCAAFITPHCLILLFLLRTHCELGRSLLPLFHLSYQKIL